MHRIRSLGLAVALIGLLGTAAWGQEAANTSPSVSAGWQRVNAADALGGVCFMVKNRSGTASETAAWTLQAPAAGDYQVQVYIPPVDRLGQRRPAPLRRGPSLVRHRDAGTVHARIRTGYGWRSSSR